MKSPENKIRDLIDNLREMSIRKTLAFQLNGEMDALRSQLDTLHRDFEQKLLDLKSNIDDV